MRQLQFIGVLFAFKLLLWIYLLKLWKNTRRNVLLSDCRWNWIPIMQIVLVDFVETSMVFLSRMSSFIRVYVIFLFMY